MQFNCAWRIYEFLSTDGFQCEEKEYKKRISLEKQKLCHNTKHISDLSLKLNEKRQPCHTRFCYNWLISSFAVVNERKGNKTKKFINMPQFEKEKKVCFALINLNKN